MSETLLMKFISEKITKYNEPSRAGTPRGEKIGFPLKKYTAAILSLFSYNLKELSELSKVSYGLLRKWRTEPDFLDLIHRSCQEFAEVFTLWFVGKVETVLKQFPDTFKVDFGYSDIVDCGLYSDLLMFEICKRLEEKSTGDIVLSISISHLLTFFQIAKARDKNKPFRVSPEIIEQDKRLLKSIQKVMLDDAIRILEKPKISEKDQELLLIMAKSVKSNFE